MMGNYVDIGGCYIFDLRNSSYRYTRPYSVIVNFQIKKP